MVANNAISSGQIAADLKLRDQTLVQAQTQVDQLAASMSSALSDQTTAGTAVTGPPAGFSVDTSNMLPGNTINLTITNTGNQHPAADIDRQRHRSDCAAAAERAERQPKADRRQYVSGGMASIVSQLNAALGRPASRSQGHGTTLSMVGSAAATVNAASTTTTASSLASGSTQLPLFTDGNSLYTGAITGSGSQMTGYAGRITVNPALLNNPAESQRLQHVAGDGGRRYHALGFSLYAVDDGIVQLLADNRTGHDGVAVLRHDHAVTCSSS